MDVRRRIVGNRKGEEKQEIKNIHNERDEADGVEG
jgi:hypothetical protein